MVFIVLTTYIEGVVPFPHRFQVLTILGFVRIGCGSALGAALFGHLFSGEMSHHMAVLGSDVSTAALANVSSFAETAGAIAHGSLLVSLRNLYGLATVIGIITLILITMGHFRRHVRSTYPTLRQVYDILRRKGRRR